MNHKPNPSVQTATVENAHTPGPWHIGMNPGPFVYGPNGEQIADLRCDFLPKEERLENLRLISAVPDLLEACKAILVAIECGDHEADLNRSNPLCVEFLRNAISKATLKQ